MSEEKLVNTAEKPRRKKSRWLLAAIIIGGFVIALNLHQFFPLNTMPISGTVVILDENGDAIPFQPTRGTFFSHYAPDIFRGEWNQKRRVTANRSGNFNIRTPEFNGTLLLLTNDEKYGAVVDVRSDEPTTGLVAELRPTHSVKGRLLDEEGNPFVDQAFSLIMYGETDRGRRVLWHLVNRSGPSFLGTSRWIPLYTRDAVTDSEGYFTMHGLIPGVEYTPYLYSPYDTTGWSFEIPFLQPEQYQEPYDLGDVIGQRRER